MLARIMYLRLTSSTHHWQDEGGAKDGQAIELAASGPNDDSRREQTKLCSAS